MGFLERIVGFFSNSEPETRALMPGRNDACWCGSGKKYKKCHLAEDETKTRKK